MRSIATLCVYLLALNLFPGLASAAPAVDNATSTPADHSVPTGMPPPAHPEALPLAQGEVAPFSGILSGERRFSLYLGQQADLEGCTLKLKVREDLLTASTQAQERSWLERNGLWLGLGAGTVAGVVLTLLTIEGQTLTHPAK